ncbi:MAG: EF-P lysine aminoacylase GenX [Alphaproteobacteria bacterium]|nr:EF-P lysine aminoacylase GenX [Alphaproteobacteria bacterium]
MNSRIPFWHAGEYARRLPLLKQRSKVVEAIRSFFVRQDFLEVETPILQISPGLEPHLKAFRTELAEPFGQADRVMYLHTSPEFAMKKLLAAGLPKIFQMARVFRNEERSKRHHPEFVMLEWYRAHADYKTLMDDTVDLVRACAQACGVKVLKEKDRECDPFAEWERISVCEACRKYAGFELEDTLPEEPSLEPDPAPLAKAARQLGIETNPQDRWDDIYFRIAYEKIEPNLGRGVPTILYDYPVCMAALSRRKPSDPRFAERFEVYVGDVELANAFSELTDAAEQRQRFEHDMDLKEKLYGERYPIDEDFIAAVAAMPPAAGIAVGVDRLVMLIAGAERIEDVLWAPVA